MPISQNTQYTRLPKVLLPWFSENARDLPWRRDTEPYHVWVSEIMLQQTRVEAVRGYYERFLEALPNIEALARADDEALLKLWEGLGYYSRVRNMKKAAQEITENHGGEFPKSYKEVLALPGIGAYTAGAVCSICYEQPTAAVDGNVLRIISRITESFDPIDLPETKKRIAEELERVYPKDRCGAFTQALMELGACVCTPRSPKCEICPAKAFCLAAKHGTAGDLPVKLPKRQKKEEQRTVFLLEHDGKLAIQKRAEKGLLSGLWQFPNVEGTLSPEEALKAAQGFGTAPSEMVKELHKTHIFTHIKWEMTGYHIRCAAESAEFIWTAPEKLTEAYALPTAFRIFLEG